MVALADEPDGSEASAAGERPPANALTVTLTAVGSGPPAEVRLRAALKVLLRQYGLRASWPECGRCRGNGDEVGSL